ncbi:hypothetical protein [Coraliomargarita parva]|uniref:hypothetical protein n=1 Tax=Coraliomargarita parva TaxID=3014050 RepID=UPI0022B2C226|nr:hypothetical protein [Coraliomargarita parva]
MTKYPVTVAVVILLIALYVLSFACGLGFSIDASVFGYWGFSWAATVLIVAFFSLKHEIVTKPCPRLRLIARYVIFSFIFCLWAALVITLFTGAPLSPAYQASVAVFLFPCVVMLLPGRGSRRKSSAS